jgi:hypothetical protein
MNWKQLIIIPFFILINTSFAQQKAKVFGIVYNAQNIGLESVTVAVEGTSIGVATGESGFYLLELEVNKPYTLVFSYLSFETKKELVVLKQGEEKRLDITLTPKTLSTKIVTVYDQRDRIEGMQVIDPAAIATLPNPSGNLEGIIKMLNGVSSNNELTSQYNVRGGNFDENLVYVNDFEIYRPLLIRSGQQEGLSFANPDLVNNLKFSAGGFAAKYGDKLSSVLDIQYKQPKKFGGTVSLSILGQSLSLEGCNKNKKLTYLFGFRNKTNQSLLKSQQTTGQYQPVFNDVQAYVTYDITKKIEIQAIANYNQNRFKFIPQSRTTSFGLINQTIRLEVFFDGQEIDEFNTAMGGLSGIYRPNSKLKLKFLASAFKTQEYETFDIMGQYFIGQVETDISKPTFNQIRYYLGVGTTHDYARNYLDATVVNATHLGSYILPQGYLQWGLKLQEDNINDKIKEWHRIDSAGYSLPYDTTKVNVFNYLKSTNVISSHRYSGFLQNNFNISDTSIFKIVAGVRFNYWNFNKELLISPRVQISFVPQWQRDVIFRLSGGSYVQPAFYREMRNIKGEINQQIKAQQSWHVVIGSDYNFKIWRRPFTFTAEAYYKYFTNVVPYEIDNVRTRYYGTNNAFAYATGFDCRLNGEFVEGAKSWISISVLNTKENLVDDFIRTGVNKNGEALDPRLSPEVQDKTSLRDTLLYPKWIPRPTDQRVNVALYFSDYLPRHKNYKVHLNAIYGTGLPFGPADQIRVRDTLRIPSYRRVDIGFSALLLEGKHDKYQKSKLKNIQTIWASLEIFNLLGVTNTASYLWVKDLNNTIYAVPNYLTARRLNLKLTCKF